MGAEVEGITIATVITNVCHNILSPPVAHLSPLMWTDSSEAILQHPVGASGMANIAHLSSPV